MPRPGGLACASGPTLFPRIPRDERSQSEIAVREISRRLTNLLHVLGREDQKPVKEAVSRLERVRDDLLSAMFKKGAK